MKNFLKTITLISIIILTAACKVPTSRSASKQNSSIESTIINKKFVGFNPQKNCWLGMTFSRKDKNLMFKMSIGNTKEKALEALDNEKVSIPVFLTGNTFNLSSDEIVFISHDKLSLYLRNDKQQWTLIAVLDKV